MGGRAARQGAVMKCFNIMTNAAVTAVYRHLPQDPIFMPGLHKIGGEKKKKVYQVILVFCNKLQHETITGISTR